MKIVNMMLEVFAHRLITTYFYDDFVNLPGHLRIILPLKQLFRIKAKKRSPRFYLSIGLYRLAHRSREKPPA